ncbi:MAG TPA: peptidyl-prolyl cis-trans isomerase, partial [Candidatus Thermoplasmatota archaeon]
MRARALVATLLVAACGEASPPAIHLGPVALAEEPGGEARAGLLPPGREGAWVPEFWAAALALEPGELSPVAETQYGYHVLRLEGRTIVPFPEARSVVARRVARTLVDPRG